MSDSSGHSVSTAGDINGDGLDDLIVGAWEVNPSNKESAGKSSSVSMSMLPPPSTRARLPTLVCANAVMLLALMIMVSLPAPALKESAGKSYVIFGKTDTDAIDLTKLSVDLKYAIDYLGNEKDNTFTGASDDEIFVAECLFSQYPEYGHCGCWLNLGLSHYHLVLACQCYHHHPHEHDCLHTDAEAALWIQQGVGVLL
jgi:hypothetical protein